MARTILVCSGKGGTGKTTCSVNLAAAFKLLGEDVLLIDGNLETPNVGMHLGSPKVDPHIQSVLSDKASLKSAIYKHKSGLRVLPASIALNAPRRFKNFSKVFNKVNRLASIIVVDGPAGLGPELSSLMQHADEMIVVTNAEMPAIADALKTCKLAEGLGKQITGIIVNKKVGEVDIELTNKEIEAILDYPIISDLPSERSVKEALSIFSPVVLSHPEAEFTSNMIELASKLAGKKYKPPKKGFWARLFGW